MARRQRGRPAPPSVVDLVRALGPLLAELGLSELEVSAGDVSVRLQRAVSAAPATTTGAPSPAPAAGATGTATITIEAPMVGTFYRASSPTAEPYVREGDAVKEGQVLCIIEAMKLMNEIESKASGRIATILVENGHAVEYGQPLFLLEPAR